MRISRIAITVVAAVCALSVAGPATAQPYPPSAPTLTVSAATVFVGEEVVVNGTGYGANEEVVVEVDYGGGAGGSGGGGSVQPGRMADFMARAAVQRLAVVTDSHGHFTTTLRLTQVGTAVITATGSSTGRSASVTVTVLEPGTALPVTSTSRFDLTKVLLASGAALAIGVVLVLLSVARRRRLPSVKV